MPKMNHHPLSNARESDVLAVSFGINQWGFIRVLRGSALGIWDKWSREPTITLSSLDDKRENWFCYFLSPRTDKTDMVALGSLPFRSDEEAWAPPCFYPPDIFQNHYRIYYQGMFRDGSVEDATGFHPSERVKPFHLAAKLQSLFSAGLLQNLAPDN